MEQEYLLECWYCGFTKSIDSLTGEEYMASGSLAQYVGDGLFMDGDEEVDMSIYDCLIEQI